jgi:hypothetical protein
MKPIHNPHDRNRLVLMADEKNRIIEHLGKGWITRVEFKEDGMMEINHYKKPKPA